MSTSKVKAALTRKLGPLPAWAWLLLGGGGIYYWRHRTAKAAAVATGTVAGVPAGAGSAVDSGLGAGAGDSGGAGAPLPPIAGAGGAGSWDPTQQPAPTDTTATAPSSTATPPATTSPLRGTAGRLSQPLTGAGQPLRWGGRSFTSKAAFARWAGRHGSTVAKELSNHPEAARIYAQLSGPSATAADHAPARRSVKTVVKGLVQPRASRTPTAKPTVPAPPRPVSVRGATSRVVHAQPAGHAATSSPTVRASRTQPQTRTAVAMGKARPGAQVAYEHREPVAAAKPLPAAQVAHEHRQAPDRLGKPAPHAPTTKAPKKVAPIVHRGKTKAV